MVCRGHSLPSGYCQVKPKLAGYGEPVRRQALLLYAGGMNVREAGRFAGVNHQTVANWVEEASEAAKGTGAAAPGARRCASEGVRIGVRIHVVFSLSLQR